MARPRVHTAESRRHLVAVATQILATEGESALTTRRLASECDTSTTAIYSSFGSRAGVLDAVFVEAFRSFGEAQRRVPVTDDPAADLLGLGLAYRRWALRHPHEFSVMFAGPASPERLEASTEPIRPLVEAVQRALQAGVLRGDAWDIVQGLWAAVHGLTVLELGGQCRARAPQAQATRILLAALNGWR